MVKQFIVVACATALCVGCQNDLPTERNGPVAAVVEVGGQAPFVTSTLGLQQLWSHQVGDGSFPVDPWWVRTGEKGETYVMGLTAGPLHGVANVRTGEGEDCFISKYDAGGTRLWTAMVSRPGSAFCSNPSFGILTNGTIRAVISSTPVQESNYQTLDVVDLSDTDGSVIRTFTNVGSDFVSVTSYVDRSGVVTVQGVSWEGGVPNPNGSEVRRYRSDLSLLWKSPLSEWETWGLTVDPSTSWVVAPTPLGIKVFDASGTLRKECALPADHFAWYYAFAPDHPSAIYVSNYNQIDFKPWLAKLDWSTCQVLWESAPEVPDFGQGADVQIDRDGNVWQSGYFFNSANGTDDIFLRVVTPDGVLLGEHFFGSATGMETLWSFAFDRSGSVSLFAGYAPADFQLNGEGASQASAFSKLRSLTRWTLLSQPDRSSRVAGGVSSIETGLVGKSGLVQKLGVQRVKSKEKKDKKGNNKS